MNAAKYFIATVLVVLCACSSEQASPTPVFYGVDNPERLSDWGMVVADQGNFVVAGDALPYDIATPLFSDYALKLRTVWTPGDAAALYKDNDAFEFPVGTVITKTFYYPKHPNGVAIGEAPPVSQRTIALDDYRIVETRLLVRREHGWDALPYIWNDDQSDATLARIGDIKPMTLVRENGAREDFNYLVPNANQCAACHATNASTKAIQPIGLKARHLNIALDLATNQNQLEHWSSTGLLRGFDPANAPANADWQDDRTPLDERARAYLDINCSHCHNPNGAADTSGLNLEPDAIGPALGVCKSPIAAGGGTGGRPFGVTPGQPGKSITLYRLETTDPGAMMPELGRALTHQEGVALISEWIAEMEGDCG